jgi:hypothetical protein
VWAVQNTPAHVNTLALLAFFAAWCAIMGSFTYFSWRVAPAALTRWAESEGYQIIKRKKAGMFDWFRFAKGSGHWIYRIVVMDKTGRSRSGLVRVGNPYWICLSVNRCPAEARWDPSPADGDSLKSRWTKQNDQLYSSGS